MMAMNSNIISTKKNNNVSDSDEDSDVTETEV